MRALILVVIGLWPPLALLSLHIWKDVAMGELLAISVGLILLHHRKPSPWLAMGALATLLLAAQFRHNALTAVVPLLVIASWQLATDVWPRFQKRAAVAVFAGWIVALVGSTSLLEIGAAKSEGGLIPAILLWDIAAMSVIEGKHLFPNYYPVLAEGDVMSAVKEHFNPYANYPVYEAISPYPKGISVGTIVADWFKIVVAHPTAYLRHRLYVFSIMLGLGPEVYYPVHPGIDQNDAGLEPQFLSQERFWRFIVFAMNLGQTAFYRIWIYVACLAVSFAYAIANLRQQNAALLVGITSSGLLTMASMLIVAPAADFRFMNWVVASGLISLILVVKHCVEARRGIEADLDRVPGP